MHITTLIQVKSDGPFFSYQYIYSMEHNSVAIYVYNCCFGSLTVYGVVIMVVSEIILRGCLQVIEISQKFCC